MREYTLVRNAVHYNGLFGETKRLLDVLIVNMKKNYISELGD